MRLRISLAGRRKTELPEIVRCHGLQRLGFPSETSSKNASHNPRPVAATQTDISKQNPHLKAPAAKKNRCGKTERCPIHQVTTSATSRNGLINTIVILALGSISAHPAKPSSFQPGEGGVPEVICLRAHSPLNLAAQEAEKQSLPATSACSRKISSQPRGRNVTDYAVTVAPNSVLTSGEKKKKPLDGDFFSFRACARAWQTRRRKRRSMTTFVHMPVSDRSCATNG